MTTTLKRGDTYIADVAVTDNGEPVDLTGLTLTAQLRQKGVLITDLLITPVDLVAGLLTLQFATPTDEFPLGVMEMDIRAAIGNEVFHTETAKILFTESITKPFELA